jgi:hypothetical protein
MAEYETKVNIKACKGPYVWCGNNYDGEKSGDYLSNCEKIEEKTMVSIDIQINDTLFKQIDHIEIHNEGGFLAHYIVGTLKKPSHHFFFDLKYDAKEGGNYKICYKKIMPRKEDTKILSRAPMKTIYSEIIKIPFVQAHNSECAICLEPVIDNKYISFCQHMFHTTCVFDYAKQNNYIKPLAQHCKLFRCGHGEKLIPFPCPICRCTLEDNI